MRTYPAVRALPRDLLLLVLFVLLLCGQSHTQEVSDPPESADSTEQAFLDRLMYLSFGVHYQAVEKFAVIKVMLQSDEELGLDESTLDDYTRLRFRNNFADIDYDEKLGSTPQKDLPPDKEYGCILIDVWTVGTDYPVAYHISISAGTTEEYQCHRNAILGISSKIRILDDVKDAIDSLMEGFAIEFFKLRGEL